MPHHSFPAVGLLAAFVVTPTVLGQVSVSTTAELYDAVSNATSGTVIDVAAGTYVLPESLQVRTGITLRGAGDGRTVLRAADSWQADFSGSIDDGVNVDAVTPGSYLIDMGRDVSQGSTFTGLAFEGPRLHGAIYGTNVDGLTLTDNQFREFGWSGVRLWTTDDATITNNTFTDTGGKSGNGKTGGALFLTYQTTTEIADNTFAKTPGRDNNMYGVKTRQLRNSRIANNTIDTNFAVEIPFENSYGVEITGNYLDGTVSLPKFNGGITTIDGKPVEAGDTFRLHRNYFTRAYSIEGPRNGLEIDHNLFDIDPDDDNGNLIATFGSERQTTTPGPLSFHDNNVKNPGRGVFWSDIPQDNLEFVRNHILADETTENPVAQGLFGFRVSQNDGDATDFSTILIADNLIEVIGGERDLFRNDSSYNAQVMNNLLVNVNAAGAPDGFNPMTGDPIGPDTSLFFRVGAGGAFQVDGFTITPIPEPAGLALLTVPALALRRRRAV